VNDCSIFWGTVWYAIKKEEHDDSAADFGIQDMFKQSPNINVETRLPRKGKLKQFQRENWPELTPELSDAIGFVKK